ncbi:hypothetical protein Cgig2_004218 [Carnegiea gigantea]|uniref:Uncharacterized protein n=1 Tax=Carnegiea gigantea TaxID=171969 RepID=A0A9Q1GWB9_9CARY|nr:hypothetical protein Cgig2_004218 [Carnegiea gigantea]
MAIPKASFRACSLSLPSASHPHGSIKDHLRRLRASQARPSSLSSITHNLCSIKDFPRCTIPNEILALESAFRRGSVDEGIQAFFISRKKMIKTISKRLVELMKAENACASIYIENYANIVNMLTEAQVISLLTLKSVLSHLKTRGWSTIANLSRPKTCLPMQEMPQVYKVAHSLPAISEKQALKQRQH